MDVGTIRNRLSRGEPIPPSIKIGRRRLFPEAELELWLKTKLVSNDNGFEDSFSHSYSKETSDE
jgi:hypothetical protein